MLEHKTKIKWLLCQSVIICIHLPNLEANLAKPN